MFYALFGSFWTREGFFFCIKDKVLIDPPYNTGNDFVYADDFADPMARYKEVTQQTTKSNPETMGRFHTNWLNMMYPRLRLAANLLRDDGVIFISIDDGEQANLRRLCDEVFGEENFVANIMWQKRYSPANDHKTICPIHDFVMVYQKSEAWHRNLLERTEQNDSQYKYEDDKGVFRPDNYKCNKTADERPNLYYPITNPNTGEEIWPSRDAVWRYSQERHNENVANDMVYWGKDGTAKTPAFKRYRHMLRGGGGIVPGTWWTYDFAGHNDEAAKEVSDLIGNRVFSTPKPVKLITKILKLSTLSDSEDIVLDFFSGSAATAHAVMQLNAEDGGNRRFILVQLPEICDENSEAYKAGYKNICEIGKERIRRAGAKIKNDIDIREEYADDQRTLLETGLEGRPVKSIFGGKTNGIESKVYTEIDENGDEITQGVCPTSEKDKYRFHPELLDIGFRVFTLDTSNLKTWDGTPVSEEQMDLLVERMNGMIHRVKSDRSDMDMVSEIMLKLGVPLTCCVGKVEVNGKAAYTVGDDCLLLICLAPDVQPADVEAMAEYAPAKLIISRESFADDTAMANAHYILRDKGIELKLV